MARILYHILLWWVAGWTVAREGITFEPPGVTPFTGVWIEIPVVSPVVSPVVVTPFTGVWIEISETGIPVPVLPRHTLHGCVD